MDVPTPPLQYCTECGQPWPFDDLARFGDRLVCVNCKNAYSQKLREGVPAQSTFVYAGFWIRFVAAIIDGVILYVAGMLVQLPLAGLMRGSGLEMIMMGAAIAYVIDTAIGATYEAVFISRFAATPGKMALNLKVVRSDGSPVTLGRAFARYFGKVLSGIILCIGFIMAGFDSQKRALHDMLCDTRVIKTGN